MLSIYLALLHLVLAFNRDTSMGILQAITEESAETNTYTRPTVQYIIRLYREHSDTKSTVDLLYADVT